MSADGGMFDPLNDGDHAAVTATGRPNADEIHVVIPIPDDAPEPNWPTLSPAEVEGNQVKVWTYQTPPELRARPVRLRSVALRELDSM